MEFVNAHGVQYTPSNWLTFDDVYLQPQQSFLESRNDSSINLSTQLTFQNVIESPLVSANMDTVTGPEMAIKMHSLGGFGILHRYFDNHQSWERAVIDVDANTNIVGFSIGLNADDIQKTGDILQKLRNKRAIVAVDVAHGHMTRVYEQVRKLKLSFNEQVSVIAGNVATPQGVAMLIKAGADCISVGVGCGSFCSTRVVTGHGIPQLSAIMMARAQVNNMQSNVSIMADGGIRNSGDIVKALAAGADTVMIGNLFAGTDESPGNISDGKKLYRGQSSQHFLNDIGKENVAAEGVHGYVEAKGSVENIYNNLIQGLRSGMTYSGVRDLRQLTNRARFIEISHHGHREGLPYHGNN